MSVNNLQGPIALIHAVIQQIGPTTARDIEQHPEVVKVCRSSKSKARRHIERLVQLGYVRSDGASQMARFWVERQA